MLNGSAWTARAGRYTVVLAVFALAVCGGAIASSFIPTLIGAQTGGGQIQGCVNNFTGGLRIVYSTSQCSGQERAISWNEQGPGGLLDIEVVRESAVVTTEDERNDIFLKATCPVGYNVTGGGARRTGSAAVDIVEWYLDTSAPGEKGDTGFPDADGWFARFGTLDDENAVGTYSFAVEAVCVQTAS